MWLAAENSPAIAPSLNMPVRSGGLSQLQTSISETHRNPPVPQPCLDPAFMPRPCLAEKLRILVVEDDPMQRLVLVSLLKNHGHQVVAVSDGDAAWEAIGNSTFNIVFTDWMMPGMTGLELTHKIRMTRGGHYVYVILCTSRSSRADLV